MDTSNVCSSSERIAELISSIKPDPEVYAGQTVDEDLVAWYDARFNMFVEDGMRSCITQYMRKAQLENTNQLTKLIILHLGLNK